jgi:hypothetical protein
MKLQIQSYDLAKLKKRVQFLSPFDEGLLPNPVVFPSDKVPSITLGFVLVRAHALVGSLGKHGLLTVRYRRNPYICQAQNGLLWKKPQFFQDTSSIPIGSVKVYEPL